MSDHDQRTQKRLRKLVQESYADVRFGDSMANRVRERMAERRTVAPRWVERAGLAVAAVALFAIGFNAAVLFSSSASTAPPDYVITDLPGAAISYQETMQP